VTGEPGRRARSVPTSRAESGRRVGRQPPNQYQLRALLAASVLRLHCTPVGGPALCLSGALFRAKGQTRVGGGPIFRTRSIFDAAEPFVIRKRCLPEIKTDVGGYSKINVAAAATGRAFFLCLCSSTVLISVFDRRDSVNSL
jgi:hypothetical protein